MPTPRCGAVLAGLVALALLGAACSSPEPPRTTPARTSGTSLPALSELPQGCRDETPSPDDAPVAFASDGRAWAASADGRRVWCLFEVASPGPFLWGPQGDRVVLGGLEVRGVGAPVARPPLSIVPISVAWTGAAGDGLAFVPPGGLNLELAGLRPGQLRELTPLRGATYRAVAAHPSGRALAFTVLRGGADEVWLSTTEGTGAVQVAAVRRPARVGPLAFSITGKALYYGLRLSDGSRRVAVWSLVEAKLLTPAWTGRRDVQAIIPRRDVAGGELAVDVGAGCRDRQAILTELGGGPGRPLLPQATQPTNAVGWLDARRVLVAQGGCDGPVDLWAADTGGGQPRLLARNVLRAGLRRPDPSPPPAPPNLVRLARATA
jgi:hypothetical protein